MPGPSRGRPDPKDPEVTAEIARAKKGAELANICPPGEKMTRSESEISREGYKPAGTEDRRSTDPRGPTDFKPMIQNEVLRLVQGKYMTLSRAQALKRVVRRIRALMGVDAPAPAVLKWWVAEMMDMLECESGVVRLGALRVFAESIGLLRPGAGLMVRSSVNRAIPIVAFKTVPQKRNLEQASGVAMLNKIELTTPLALPAPEPPSPPAAEAASS